MNLTNKSLILLFAGIMSISLFSTYHYMNYIAKKYEIKSKFINLLSNQIWKPISWFLHGVGIVSTILLLNKK